MKQSHDLEDPVDIYNHTKQFFKKDEGGDDYAQNVEIGERKIKGDLTDELDMLVYGGKKVTRKDLETENDFGDEGS